MTAVTVIRDRYVRGWPRHTEGERAYVLELGAALERAYTSDAHFTAYQTPNGRRLVREAIDQGVAVELTAIVFDVDCPDTHGTSDPTPEAWRRELREKVVALAAAHPDPYYYETRGGARIVYRQSKATVLRAQANAQEWSQLYAVAVAHLERRFGIVADPACADWQRLYRLPHATRDAGGKPENWPIMGDGRRIGTLTINATHADVERAKRESKSFRARPTENFVPSDGDGLLYYLLRSRADVDREAPRGGWICRCPNRAVHTSNTDWTDSTVVYPPKMDAQIGIIECKHAHCQRFKNTDWLKFFSDAELDVARIAAGIVRAA